MAKCKKCGKSFEPLAYVRLTECPDCGTGLHDSISSGSSDTGANGSIRGNREASAVRWFLISVACVGVGWANLGFAAAKTSERGFGAQPAGPNVYVAVIVALVSAWAFMQCPRRFLIKTFTLLVLLAAVWHAVFAINLSLLEAEMKIFF